MSQSRPTVYLRLYNTNVDKAVVNGIQLFRGQDLKAEELFYDYIKSNKRVEYIPGSSNRTGNSKVELTFHSLYSIIRFYKLGISNFGLNETETRLAESLLREYKEEILKDIEELTGKTLEEL
jgi:hypothetical protein